ncbi:ABC transporter permease [Agrococcus jejuensis]|uniref:Putative ABC transport system permease protein n=1 Tax=Agrococcus jejuensis TaxID=399736 RepID=A0A1G8ANJ4_9MICO|nr:ABC transporter permease [Agrococcus jejuensis]SDH22423.1 putative ABC transport system permease protein [Agrococcus jejuensis]
MRVIAATFVEAVAQLRIHRVRVMLSLVGVAVAVAALTASVAMGDIVRQTSIESMEQSSGRPATFGFSAYSLEGDPIDADALVEEAEAIAERYDIRYMSPVTYLGGSVQLGDVRTDAQVMGVGVDYQAMHRVEVTDGRWFVESDAERLAPPVVVNQYVMDMLGFASAAQHPTIALPDGRTAVVVGVIDSPMYQGWPYLWALPDTAAAISGADPAYAQPTIEMWVPEESADAVQTMVTRDLQGAFPDAQVDSYRQDYAAYFDEAGDPTAFVQQILLGISGVVLLLGALSLVNIAVITVRHRVRELGIRRAFGASLSRVFVGVMLESVVGTVVAGVVGIMVVVLAYRLLLVEQVIPLGLPGDLPAFPVWAAIVGLAVATAVGAIAGIIPAVVAVRSKVIDAIRF